MSSDHTINAISPTKNDVQASDIPVCSNTNLQQQSRRTGNGETFSEQRVPFSISLPADPSPNQKQWASSQFWNLVSLIGINIGIPLAIYYSIRDNVGIAYPLLISGLPPLVYVTYFFYRERRVDILGFITFLSFILSAAVSVTTGK